MATSLGNPLIVFRETGIRVLMVGDADVWVEREKEGREGKNQR